jgi:hypothetical protein
MAKLKRILRAHFEILGMAKQHFLEDLVEEVEWWMDEDERVAGVVYICTTDHDWAYSALGRDTTGRFRAIDGDASLPSRVEASEKLKACLAGYADAGDSVFPQGDEKEKRKEILKPVVSGEKLHPDFKHLIEDTQFSAARRVIEETAYAFIDIDGNYIRDFQTTGFPGRLWELYLFRFLYEQRFELARHFNRPDYCAVYDGFRVGIEAVTVNPTLGETAPEPTPAEVRHLHNGYMPIKFGSALYSKLQKKYWDDPHMEDVSLALAIHDFHGPRSMVWSGGCLPEYLYGVRHSVETDASGNGKAKAEPITEHVWGHKKIPSGFFGQPDAENISAVLFSNSSTLSKWNRMGRLAGLGAPDTVMYRRGYRVNPDPDALVPVEFSVEVKPGGTYEELWSDDIVIYYNPNALRPIPFGLFRGCSNMFWEDGALCTTDAPGKILGSMTWVVASV